MAARKKSAKTLAGPPASKRLRRPARRLRQARIAFEALSIEGGLLSPEWLARIAQLGAAHQVEADYRVPKGLLLRDEIGRYWRIAQAHFGDFEAGRVTGGADPQALADRFVLGLLREAFGFTSLVPVEPAVIGERSYPVRHRALDGRVPVVIASAGSGVDTLSPAFGDDNRQRSAFGLAQEALNAGEHALWGIATDGATLRIVRDNASLTRPAWIEADLERIFREERYADFAALWLIAHETRFGTPGGAAADCSLETWRSAGREEGTRAREHLREGVEEALLALGQGFLSHPENGALRDALHAGRLTPDAYFQELLRLVYRLIFLLTAEERSVLHPDGADPTARARYEAGYGLRRLRDRSVRRSAHDRFSDLWDGFRIVLRGVARGEPRLALPALGGLFSEDQCPSLDAAKLENRSLLAAVFRLSWLREASGLSRVNWRDMGPEELGSVYESLLELVPRIPEDGRGFSFAEGADTKGNARKTTGSYYTPDSLVQVLLDSALEPVVQQTVAANPQDPVSALLSLSIVDPACGSGHFLLAAARRLAGHVARHQANGTPSAAQYRHALRQVVSRCVFGVDLNPMAVELGRVSLWMEAVEPGRPLSFLDSHVQVGNALLGTTPELMAKGIPDAAWEPIEGDDRKTASLLKKRNKAAAEGQRGLESLWARKGDDEAAAVVNAVREIDDAPDADLPDVAAKEKSWEELQASAAYRHQRFVADAWCAAFVWPKPQLPERKAGKGGDGDVPPVVAAAPTNDLWRQLRDGQGAPPLVTIETVEQLAMQYRFFHWHLQFPQVFAKGGFDVVLGNPPWERVKLQEQEFFASRHDQIANAPNAAARKKLIAALSEKDPQLWNEWCEASRQADGESHLVRDSGRYPLCGKGDVNTYAIFAEHNLNAIGSLGRAGFVVPSGIATDDTTKEYFGTLAQAGRLSSLFDFRNHDGLFYDVGHRRFKFCLLTVLGRLARGSSARLVFFAESAAELREPDRQFTLSPADIALLNPNTRTCSTFRSRRDADINLAIYRRVGVLWREDDEKGNPWGLRFMAMLHMANDSGLFRAHGELDANRQYLPLVEAKMVHHFDHRYGDYADKPAGSLDTQLPDVPVERLGDPTYSPTARYAVPASEVGARLADRWTRGWLVGWRDICRSTDERTVIASLIPRAGVGDKFLLMMASVEPALVACLYGSLCSFALDYTARQKVGGTSLKYFTMRQLPVLAPETYETGAAWCPSSLLREWLLPRVLELTYTAWDVEPFARDVGYDGPPFRWDPEHRFLLRAELDAAFFHLYGISRHDADYILETFPIVRKNDEKVYREYRTKRVILEIYDELAEAIRTGRPYQTRLDPPAADPSVAHEPRTPVRIAKPDKVPVLPDGAWRRPKTDHAAEIGVVLAAMLKAFGRPVPIRQVRLAAALALEPTLALGSLTGKEAEEWRRLVGNEAELLPPGVISIAAPTNRAWGSAVIQLRGSGLLVEDGRAGTWGPGSGIDQILTEGWADGRARWVVDLILHRGEKDVVAKLSPELQGWVHGASAA